MALTVTKIKPGHLGDRSLVTADVAFDSSYPTGGESLTPAMLGLRVIDVLIAPNRMGLAFDYDYTNSKLLAYVPGATLGAAGAGTIDDFPISGVGSTAVSIGATAGSADTRFGLEKEIANTTDLSTITAVKVIAIGV